jgi:hypothetical protein
MEGEVMAPPEGNRFWEVRTTHGRNKLFQDEGVLWAAAVEYFEWVENNPLKGAKLFKIKNDSDKDEIVEESYSKMRAMTIEGLCLFLDINRSTWYEYRGLEDYSDIIGRIENVIRDQKFSGAAADLLNANIIARDLGLKDSTETVLKGSLTDLTEDELNRKLEQLRNEQAAQDPRD